MTLQSIPGAPFAFIAPGWAQTQTVPAINSSTIDAAKEAIIYIGRVVTSDGASHTIDTTGSSSIGWRTATVTNANAGTVVKVGIAPVDTANGPPGRANNTTDVINFDVAAVLSGSGVVTANAWQTNVPTTGTKTIANGDLVAVCIQMTTLGGADSIIGVFNTANSSIHQPVVTAYTGAYGVVSGTPNAVITFSDGAIGFLFGSDIFSTLNTRTWNSSSSPAEFGQLFSMPFPMKVCGLCGWMNPGNDLDLVLYSDPLGTPSAQKTVSIDANTVAAAAGRRFAVMFSSPYTTAAGQPIAAVFKPGASNVSAYYKTLASAAHRVSDVWGTSGYGVSRSAGAFADANSSLDHYYIGLIVSAFEHGVQPNYVLGL